MKDIENLLENFTIEDNIDFDIDFVMLGYEVLKSYKDGNIEPYSSNVTWEVSVDVKKNSIVYSVFIYGRASANISYDRWVDTDSYVIENYTISEIKEGGLSIPLIIKEKW